MGIIPILFLGLVLRLINLNQSFWLDEAAQALESQNSVSWLWQWMTADFHPPLYHFLIHFWIKLGQADWFLKLPSVFFGVLTIYFLYLLGKKLVSEKFGLLAAFLLAVSPFHIYFSQELRMYSLSALLTTVSMYFFLEAIREDKLKSWVIFILVSILNIYTLYFGFFVLAAQLGYLLYERALLRRVWKKFILSSAIVAASFIFWLPQFLIQLQGGTWLVQALPGWQEAVSSPVTKAPLLVLIKFFLGQISLANIWLYGLVTLSLTLLLAVLLFKGFRSQNKKEFLFFFVWFTVPLVLATVISFWVPVISPKRLLLTTPAFAGLLALGIISFVNKKKIFLIGVMTLISLVSLSVYYLNPKFQRENWKEAVTYVENNGDEKSLSLFEFSDPFAPYLWYRTGKIKDSRAFDGVSASSGLVGAKMPSVTAGADKIFLFQYLSALTDPQQLVTQWLVNHRWQLKETKDFNGVGFIYIYEKSF